MVSAPRPQTAPEHDRSNLPAWVRREAEALVAHRPRDENPTLSGNSSIDVSPTKPEAAPVVRGKHWLAGWAIVATGALAIALFISIFAAKSFWIPSNSMAPELEPGDRVLVNKLVGEWSDPGRGDLVVFARPGASADLVKRVVGLPGEVVSFADGFVTINGETLEESYLAAGTTTAALPASESFELGDDEYFVLGDNRQNSADSRAFGPVERDAIAGTVFLKFWPLGDVTRY